MRFPRVLGALLVVVGLAAGTARAQLLPQLPQVPLPQPGAVLGAASQPLGGVTRTVGDLRELIGNKAVR